MSQSVAMKELGRQLAAARRKLGWRLSDVSERTGRHVARISDMERGKGNATAANLAEAGAALGLRLMFIPEDRASQVLDLIGRPPDIRPRAYDVPSVFDEVYVEEDDEERHAGS